MSKNCNLSTRVEPLVFVIGVWPSNLYELHIAASDSSNHVRNLDDLSNALVGEAVLVCGCQGRRTLFSALGSLNISTYCNDATWTGHLKREGSIMRYRIEASESFASE